jgi:Ferric reductase like transmembrane component
MTLLASNGQALWYLTRGSGTVALLLLTASVLLGVMNSTRWRTAHWPRFLSYGLHRNVTLLAIAFTLVHVVTTITDAFAPIGWIDAFIPFLTPYRPFWLGMGTLAFDLLLALTITSFLRRRIGVRAWRLVHWLAYASWPVALLHSLGTGSDARTGWLAALGVLSGLLVFAAVMWRVWEASDALPLVRAGATLGGLAVLIGLLVWARGGPLEKGWATRAGTPSSLLGHRRTAATVAAAQNGAAAPTATIQTAPSLPSGRFDATLRGTLKQVPAQNGLVTILIDARATGRFAGLVHLALRGQAIEGGGVQMIDSVVGLLPTGAASWASGRVIGLNGQQVLTSVQTASGGSTQVQLDLQIDSSSGTVTGTLHGGVRQ